LKYSDLLHSFLYALLAIFLLLILEMNLFDMLHKMVTFFVAGITVAILVLWLLNLRSFYKFTIELNKESVILETDRLQLEESQKLIQTLSSQRHDFKNQLQVIRMLAQMNKNQEIINYIQECNTSMDLSTSIYIHINNPAISAMLLVFFTQAKEKELKFSVDCDMDFTDFKFSTVAITRILGNIIRNAIEILDLYQAPERAIQVTFWETTDCYNFIIWNNGPVIPDDIKPNIFTAGFSTKNSSGLGLSIVKQMVEEMRGRITVSSDPKNGTEFRIVLPKKAPLNFLSGQQEKTQETHV
jgi:sensor histidine kinase regulating citrate/malate metabolism